MSVAEIKGVCGRVVGGLLGGFCTLESCSRNGHPTQNCILEYFIMDGPRSRMTSKSLKLHPNPKILCQMITNNHKIELLPINRETFPPPNIFSHYMRKFRGGFIL
jgi:hypothetical protein